MVGFAPTHEKAVLLSRGLMDGNYRSCPGVCSLAGFHLITQTDEVHGTAALRSCAGFCGGAACPCGKALGAAGCSHPALSLYPPASEYS